MASSSAESTRRYVSPSSSDINATTSILLSSASNLCADVARLSEAQWAAVNSDEETSALYAADELKHIREIMKVAILYTVGYLFEHREKADYTELTLTLRSLLFAIREGVV